MLSSARHKIYPAHKFKMPTIVVGILTCISMINTTSERRKAIKFFIYLYFSFYEQLKFHALFACLFDFLRPINNLSVI